jgi:phosphate transport system substrate-binding protein
MVLIGLFFPAPWSQTIAAPEEDGVIRIGGSTTLLPVMATAANDFMNKYVTWDRVDPRLPNKKITIYVSGGGSGFGIQSTLQGTIHIGLVARNLKEKEERLLGAHQAILVGKDAVVFTANKDNPLAKKNLRLTKTQLAAIFSGEIKTYKEIDPVLPVDKIVLFVRDSGAGSAEIVQEVVMGDKQVSRDALQLPSQGALLKKLETNRSSIGYISFGLISSSSKLHPFLFEGVEPSNDKILSGEYVLARPLLLVVKDPHSPMIDHFINYVLTDGQKVVKDNYFVPMKDTVRKDSRKGG